MNRLKLAQLPTFRNRITLLRIRSIDPQLYITQVVADGVTYDVADEHGLVSFRSQNDAKKPFVGLGIRKTLLSHRSSYDEMIGMPSSHQSEIEVTVQNPDDAMT
ncbi:MAG: DUF6482 family protein [Pseudomonadota bacterium]